LPFNRTLQMVFSGNSDAETVVTHWFAADRKITARFVRVVCLSCDPDLICCLRFEVFGCDGGVYIFSVLFQKTKLPLFPRSQPNDD